MGQEKNRQLRQQREQQRKKKKIIIGGSVALVVALVAAVLLMIPGAPDDWDTLVADGQSAMSSVETPPNEGDRHVSSGTRVPYDTDFPTSGAHWPAPTQPGFYTTAQPNEALVHSIEHGNIVVYYDQLSSDDRAQLESWTDFYSGTWSAVIAVPHEGLGESVVLTAWDHRLRLDEFEPAPMAAFIDAFRGRGPENPVR